VERKWERVLERCPGSQGYRNHPYILFFDGKKRKSLRTIGRNQPTSFNDETAWFDIEPGGDEGDISEIEDLSAMRQGDRPEFGRWSEKIDESFSAS
jgi:hypothetical protein